MADERARQIAKWVIDPVSEDEALDEHGDGMDIHEREMHLARAFITSQASLEACKKALREITCLDDNGEWGLFTAREVAQAALNTEEPADG